MLSILRSVIDLISVIVHPLSRRLCRNKIRILVYHRIYNLPETEFLSSITVSPRNFEQQIEYLAQNGFYVITLDQLLEYRDKNAEPPSKTVIITFDDGYRDNYTNAWHIMSKYNLKGSFFVVTDPIDSNDIFAWLKPEYIHGEKEDWLPLRRQDILEMKAGGACIGSHTMSHCGLSVVDEEKAKAELAGSRDHLEQLLQDEVRCFCYPYGDFNKSVKKLVREVGYRAAVTTLVGNNTLDSDFLTLRRIPIEGTDSLNRFIRKVEGAYDWWLGGLQPIVYSVQTFFKRG